MSFFVAFVLVVSAVCGDFSSMTAKAATSGVTGDCTWILDGTVLTISGEGDMADYRYDHNPWSTKITEVIIENGVTSIGYEAFYGCSSLISITIPESIMHIGANAFKGCSSLTSITIPDGVTNIESSTFYGCSSLTGIRIPESVTSIGYQAFYGCSMLTNIAIPNYVTHIDAYVFSGCSSLTNIIMPENVTDIREGTFDNCSSLISITIPNGVTHIGEGAFYGCSSLTSITIPESVWHIGSYAFYGCGSLTSITIPEGVTNIGEGMFLDCSALTDITIPQSVMHIGAWAFCGCSFLTSITIPESVTDIDEGAFRYCSSLTDITIPESVRSISEEAFSECSALTSITIPEKVTSIGGAAFSYCSALTSITIPENVTSIKWGAFENCSSLISIEIPKSVTSIAYNTFRDCSSLTSITIPESVTSIEHDAFLGCSSLTSVWFTGAQVDRDEMSISNGNEELLKATWHYSTCADNAHVYLANCDVSCQNCDWIREVDNDHIFALNTGYTCQECGYSTQPVAPQIESKTNSSVTLVHISGCEYSKDGENWQDSNIFTNLSLLSGSSTYTFYQRVKATEEVQVSEKSEGLVVTFKTAQSTPSAPVISSCTDTSVTLVEITNGEYSMDGVNWQSSNVFDNLLPNTEYIFYQRYAEDDSHEVSNSSDGISVTTDKSEQTLIPSAPTVEDVTISSVTLAVVEGCEYSMDGVTWQASNLFEGLSYGTQYTFYQRYSETTTAYAGMSSVALTVTTNLPYILGDVNGDEYVTTDDAIQLLYHLMFGDSYLISQPCDFDGNGLLTSDDAIYLHYHINFPDRYPLKQ